jgi:hypothetical protein
MGRGHDGGKDLHISSLSEHIDLDQKQAEESSPCGVARVGATQKSSGDPHLTGNQGRGLPMPPACDYPCGATRGRHSAIVAPAPHLRFSAKKTIAEIEPDRIFSDSTDSFHDTRITLKVKEKQYTR